MCRSTRGIAKPCDTSTWDCKCGSCHAKKMGLRTSCVHLCCIAHKKEKKGDSADKSTTGSTSTSVFLRTTFRDSAITHASPLIRKSTTLTTLRSTLWCPYYGVAKRQQFSCPLGTATLSLKLEMWFQVVGLVLSRTVAM